VGSSGSGASRVVLQDGSWSPFLIQMDTLVRETPNLPVRPRRLLRSCAFMQSFLVTCFLIGVGGRGFTAATPTCKTAISLFAVGACPSRTRASFHSGDTEGSSCSFRTVPHCLPYPSHLYHYRSIPPPIKSAPRHPGSRKSQNGISSYKCPDVAHQVFENHEPLRQIVAI